MEPTLVLARNGDHPQRPLSARAKLVLAAALVVTTIGVVVRLATAGPTFVERHRPEAAAYCETDPELKFRKYPLADGTDPAPELDAFEYCVAAYISHLPAD